ncbi:hypothetical protein QA646_10230 [Rhizobium sp. CB3090]|uniref:hypothetical protein n=1 Tax=Rhizobium sp. CB3090 TaxID=3039156 RepID=UPI0024B148F4|nr:hypothetical protein [Rhizobium sp. CB3090]WFU07705.1 hypothetical protein QA646_10230 [Rhizobium sp. CB3090]
MMLTKRISKTDDLCIVDFRYIKMRRSKLFYAIHYDSMLRIWAKKEGRRKNRGPIGVKVKTSRGEQLLRWNWEEKPPYASAKCGMMLICAVRNAFLCIAVMHLRPLAQKGKKKGHR